MYQAQLDVLRKTGVNPCLLPFIGKKYGERDVIRDELSNPARLKSLRSFDTKTGDGAERADNEVFISQTNFHTAMLRLQLRKLDGFLSILEDSDYDGYCTVCSDTVTISRIVTTNSTLCIHCAQLAEQK